MTETGRVSLQVANPVTSIGGGYQWQVEVKATLPNNDVIDRIDKGTAFPDVATASAFGAGWGLEDLDSLVPVANYGELWVYGDGDPPQLFRTGAGNTYVSPPNIFGSLVKNGDGSFTFTDKHQLKRVVRAKMMASFSAKDLRNCLSQREA